MHHDAQSTHEAEATEGETINATEATRGCPFSWHYEQGFFVKDPDGKNEG